MSSFSKVSWAIQIIPPQILTNAKNAKEVINYMLTIDHLSNICFRKTFDKLEDAALQCILYNKLELLKINVHI